MRAFRRNLVALLGCLALFAGASPGRAATALTGYEVAFSAIADAALREAIESGSQLLALRDKPPPTLAALRRRADADVEKFRDLLRSRGFYRSSLSYRAAVGEGQDRASVTVDIEPGPLYTISAFGIRWVGRGEPVLAQKILFGDIGIDIGDPARADSIVGAADAIVARLAERAYPHARVSDKDVVIDHDTAGAAVTVSVDAGERASFGDIEIVGLDQADPRLVRGYVPWRRGQLYDSRLVGEFRKALMATGVFSAVRVELAAAAGSDGLSDVTVEVTEDKRRFIGGGLSYSTSEGPGANLFWGHRNLFGGGERLELRGRVSNIFYGTELQFRRPNVIVHGQDFVFGATASNQDTDAFVTRSYEVTTGLERRISSTLSASAGVLLARSEVTENGQSKLFALLGFPLGVKRDTTTDLLDPTGGGRLIGQATPYVSSDARFLSLRLRDAIYLPLDARKRFVAAGWATVGAILGADTQDIPADRRLYSGGGGSIRGYGYQMIGPLDADNDPAGGRSMVEIGGELRYRASETLGLTAFTEAGNVYDTIMPDLGEKLFVGVGVGLRYYSPIGPVRLDLAFPLDRRHGVDSAFQIYIGLGQAF